MKTAIEPLKNESQDQADARLPGAEPDAPVEKISPRQEKHSRLRHDGLEGAQNGAVAQRANLSLKGGTSSDTSGAQSLQDQQGLDLALSTKGKRKGRYSGETFERLVQQVRTLVPESQLEEVLENAIEDRAKGSGLQLPHAALNNVAEEVYEQIDHALANGDLSNSDEVMAAIAEILREHIFDENDIAYIISQINRQIRAEDVALQQEAQKLAAKSDHKTLSVQAVSLFQNEAVDRETMLYAFQNATGQSLDEHLESRLREEYENLKRSLSGYEGLTLDFDPERGLSEESLRVVRSLVYSELQAHLLDSPSEFLENQVHLSSAAQSLAKLDDISLALRMSQGEMISEEDLSAVLEQRLDSYSKGEAALRASLPENEDALTQLLISRNGFLRENLGVTFSDAEQSEIQQIYENAVEERQADLVKTKLQALNYSAGLQERFSSSEARSAKRDREEYIEEHRDILGNVPEQELRDQLYQQGKAAGARLDATVEGIRQATDWWGTDEEKFFDMLKSVESKEEMELVSKELKERTGYDIYGMIDKELSGTYKDIALDLVKRDFVSASASEYEAECNRFWGPNPDRLAEILSVARQDKERFEAVYLDRYGERLEREQRKAGNAVSIDSMEQVFDLTLSGHARELVQASYSGDEMLEYALKFKHKFGFFNDREKEAAEHLEALVAGDWLYSFNEGELIATLSEAGKQKLEDFRAKFESVSDESLDEFLEAELSGGELAWMKAILAGDRFAADAGAYRYACDGMGTDEQLLFEITEQRRASVMASVGLTEQALAESEEAREAFKRVYASYESRVDTLFTEQSGRVRSERIQEEFDSVHNVYYSQLTSSDAIIGTERAALKLRMAMGATGDGTDDAVILDVLAGRSKQEVEQIMADYSRLFDGRDLKKDLNWEVSGDVGFDVDQYLQGDPLQVADAGEKIEAMKAYLDARCDHEHSGLMALGVDFAYPEMEEKYQEFLEKYEEYQNSKSQNAATAARELENIYQQMVTRCETYRFAKNMAADAVVDTARTGAVVCVAVVTTGLSGGTAAPLWVVIASTSAASGVVSIGGRTLLKGDSYGHDGMIADAGQAAVEGGTAAIGYGAVALGRKALTQVPLSRAMLSSLGARIEAAAGSLAVKEAVAGGEKSVEYGAKSILLGLCEGVETQIDDVAVQCTLEASEEAIEQALKSGSRSVAQLLEANLVVNGATSSVVRNQVLRELHHEMQEQWIQLLALHAEKTLVSRAAIGSAEGALDGFTSLGAEGMVMTGIDYRNWENGFTEGFENMLSNGFAYGVQGAGFGVGFGALFSLRSKRARMSKELSEAEVETLLRWQTQEGKSAWKKAAEEVEKEFGEIAENAGVKVKIPNKPPVKLNEKGIELIRARYESHGVVTKGDLLDAALASQDVRLTGKKAKRFTGKLDAKVAEFEAAASQATGDEAIAHARVAEHYRSAVDGVKERLAGGETITKLEYYQLKGVDKNPYFYKPKETGAAEAVAETSSKTVSAKSADGPELKLHRPEDPTPAAKPASTETVEEPAILNFQEALASKEPVKVGALQEAAEESLARSHAADTSNMSFADAPSTQDTIDELFQLYNTTQDSGSKEIIKQRIAELEETRLAAQPDPALLETMQGLQKQYDAMKYAETRAAKEAEMAQVKRKASDNIDRAFEKTLDRVQQDKRLRSSENSSLESQAADIRAERIERIDKAFEDMNARMDRIQNLTNGEGRSTRAVSEKPDHSAQIDRIDNAFADINERIERLQSLLKEQGIETRSADSVAPRSNSAESDFDFDGGQYQSGRFEGGSRSGTNNDYSSPRKSYQESDGGVAVLEREGEVLPGLEDMQRQFDEYVAYEPTAEPQPQMMEAPQRKQAEVAVMDREESILPGLEEMQRQMDQAEAARLKETMENFQRTYDESVAAQEKVSTELDEEIIRSEEAFTSPEEAPAQTKTRENVIADGNTLRRVEEEVEVDVEPEKFKVVHPEDEELVSLSRVSTPEYQHEWVPKNAFDVSPAAEPASRLREDTDSARNRKRAKKGRSQRGFQDSENGGANYDTIHERREYEKKKARADISSDQTKPGYSDTFGRWFRIELKTFFGKIFTWRVKHN